MRKLTPSLAAAAMTLALLSCSSSRTETDSGKAPARVKPSVGEAAIEVESRGTPKLPEGVDWNAMKMVFAFRRPDLTELYKKDIIEIAITNFDVESPEEVIQREEGIFQRGNFFKPGEAAIIIRVHELKVFSKGEEMKKVRAGAYYPPIELQSYQRESAGSEANIYWAGGDARSNGMFAWDVQLTEVSEKQVKGNVGFTRAGEFKGGEVDTLLERVKVSFSAPIVEAGKNVSDYSSK